MKRGIRWQPSQDQTVRQRSVQRLIIFNQQEARQCGFHINTTEVTIHQPSGCMTRLEHSFAQRIVLVLIGYSLNRSLLINRVHATLPQRHCTTCLQVQVIVELQQGCRSGRDHGARGQIKSYKLYNIIFGQQN